MENFNVQVTLASCAATEQLIAVMIGSVENQDFLVLVRLILRI